MGFCYDIFLPEESDDVPHGTKLKYNHVVFHVVIGEDRVEISRMFNKKSIFTNNVSCSEARSIFRNHIRYGFFFPE